MKTYLWRLWWCQCEYRWILTHGLCDGVSVSTDGVLTHRLCDGVGTALNFFLQGLISVQGHWKVPIMLSVAYIHLNICKTTQNTHAVNRDCVCVCCFYFSSLIFVHRSLTTCSRKLNTITATWHMVPITLRCLISISLLLWCGVIVYRLMDFTLSVWHAGHND